MADSTTTAAAATPAVGIWADPVVEVRAAYGRSEPITVRQSVRHLARDVLSKVNDTYLLQPSFKLDDMDVDYYPKDAALNSSVHDLDENGLVVLVRPRLQQRQRMRRRFKTLQKKEDMTEALFDYIENNEEPEPFESRLVNLFKVLQEDTKSQKARIAQLEGQTTRWMGETTRLNEKLSFEQEERKAENKKHKEETIRLREKTNQLTGETTRLREKTNQLTGETTRLNEKLALEQEERKAENKKHKEETARLNRDLIIEQEERKTENKNHKEETTQLKGLVTKEKDERRADVARLEKTIEEQNAELAESNGQLNQHKAELAEVKEQRRRDAQLISRLTLKLNPIHLRVLLDRSRDRVLECTHSNSWDDLRQNRSDSQLIDAIMQGLEDANVEDRPSRETVMFLCSCNEIRRGGNHFAHNADQMEIRDAIETKRIDSQDRYFLEQLYKFVFHVPL